MRIKHSKVTKEDRESARDYSKVVLAIAIVTVILLTFCASLIMLTRKSFSDSKRIKDLEDRVRQLENMHKEEIDFVIPENYSIQNTIEFEDHTEGFYYVPEDGGVVSRAQKVYENEGYKFDIRDDGVETFGGYVIVAAHSEVHPYGSIIRTSQGDGIVLDCIGVDFFGKADLNRVEIATVWRE